MGLCPSCHGCTKYKGGLVFSGYGACMVYDCADTCVDLAVWSKEQQDRHQRRHEKAVALWKEHTEKVRRNKLATLLRGSFQEPSWAKTTFHAEYAQGWRLLEDRHNKVWKWEHPTETGVVSIGAIVRPR